ncbi:hypothetical protein K438DRAFT_1938929 [Mycena galopus ATCC 62051]|nr:hypothetical protein K438DRAFT_1938929 [Mycena galopus ATCC 62051]
MSLNPSTWLLSSAWDSILQQWESSMNGHVNLHSGWSCMTVTVAGLARDAQYTRTKRGVWPVDAAAGIAGETGGAGVEEEETRNLRAQVPTQKLGGVHQWCKGLLGNGVEKPEEIRRETGFGGSWWTSGQCRDFENGGMDGTRAGVTVGLAALGTGSTLSVGLGPIAIDTRASWA